jgi:hypothetical protein
LGRLLIVEAPLLRLLPDWLSKHGTQDREENIAKKTGVKS